MREVSYAEAINEALREEMERDDNVILMGEDIAVYGGIFKVTDGLLGKFGSERVRDTPISENAIVGAAIGASILGMRPIVEIMYMDFLNECADQLLNHLPKIRFMSGGKLKTPVTIRTQYSLGRHTGAQHSQFFVAAYMNTPGLQIAVPSTPYDAKGLLKTAIRGESPTLYIECPLFYKEKGMIPDDQYTVPFGKAQIKKEGDDVTIFALSYTIPRALSATEKLEKERISVRVVDPRTLNPLDKECLVESVQKTGRIMIVEPDCRTSGVGAEIAALIAEEALYDLDAPIVRLAAPDIPVPFTPSLLDQYVPREEDIIRTIRKMVGRQR